MINRGMAWLDTGTPQALLEASNFIGAIEQRQGFKVACLEEISLRFGFVSIEDFPKVLEATPNSPYKEYLLTIFEEIKKEKGM